MKRRIEQLLNGIFEYNPGQPQIQPQQISVQAEMNAVVRGSVQVNRLDEKKLKGFVYTSSPRVICEPTEFQSINNEIRYQIDCSGLEEGTTDQGKITICTELGEYQIPYEVRIQGKTVKEQPLTISDMLEFTETARKEYQMAYKCFQSMGFRKFLQEKNPEYTAVYDSLQSSEVHYPALEEFLCGIGAKEPIRFSVNRGLYEFHHLTEPVQETIRITRNTWGYQELTIESDARFLRTEKKRLTTDEFAGSVYDLNYIIDTNLMHAGNNYGRLTISTEYQKLNIEIMAVKGEAREKSRQKHICKIMMKELESLYVNFRVNKIDLATWVERSISVLNSYRRAGGNDPYADLFLIQLYFADGKKQKAFKILESLEHQRKRLDTPDRYGFYLYLSTFFYHEAAYVDRVEAEVSKMYYRNKSNWKLFWILLYLQEIYLKDENVRYEAVAEQFRYGCRSRIMYLEAWQILKKNPFLMRHLDAYELQILRFASKEKLMTAEVIRQVANLAANQENFSSILYEILIDGYRLYPSVDLVKAICLLLMKGNKKSPEYFSWYAKGVEEGLRITGLYEAYMETMDHLEIQEMPQVIRMYFAYDNVLDYRKRAAIYRRILENKEKDPQNYHNYRAIIERFTLEQLEAVHFCEDLCVLYQAFLKRSMLNRQNAEKLARILCMVEVICENPEISRLVVHSSRSKKEYFSVFQNGKAYAELYDPDSILVLEDEKGSRSLAMNMCTIRRVFNNEDMLAWCIEKAGDTQGLVLYTCIQCLKEQVLDAKTLPYFRIACEQEDFAEEFRKELKEKVLQYYVDHLQDESLSDFLDEISLKEYASVDKTALITLLAEEGRCKEAFSLLDAYGAEGIAILQLVRICSRMVLEVEFEENSMLIKLCHYCFVSGKYDDKLLRYLLLYYEGTVQEMTDVRNAADQFDLDTMLLEEKIITMILFTRSSTQGSEPIFEEYLKKMGRKRLCKAYVNLKSYEYFVKGMPVADPVFQYIDREYHYLRKKNRLMEQEEICRLALLMHYAKSVELTNFQRTQAEKLLEEFSAKGMRFSFWKRLPADLLAPYQMEGRVFAEFAANPESKVTIFYRLRGKEDYIQENMRNYFEGIFVKEFTLFYGEELECYIEEELDGETIRSDKRILRASAFSGSRTSRYDMLNRMSELLEQGKEEELKEELDSYLTLDYLTEQVFTLV